MENGDWPSGPDYDELYAWYEGWHGDAEAYYYDDDHNGEQGEWHEPWYEAGYHEEPADAGEETLQSLRTTWMRATTRARASLALAPWAWAALHAARSVTAFTAAL